MSLWLAAATRQGVCRSRGAEALTEAHPKLRLCTISARPLASPVGKVRYGPHSRRSAARRQCRHPTQSCRRQARFDATRAAVQPGARLVFARVGHVRSTEGVRSRVSTRGNTQRESMRMYPRFSTVSKVRIPLTSVAVGIQTQLAAAGFTSNTRKESDSASYAPRGEI